MKINDFISLPLLGVVIGLVLVQTQAMIGFADFKIIYVLPFILFGFTLALIKNSSIDEKYKSWTQGGLWFLALFSILTFLFWDSIVSSDDVYFDYQREEVVYEYDETKFNEQELEYVTFQYPNDLETTIDSIGVVKLLSSEKVPWGSEMRPERMYAVSETMTDISDFGVFANQYANSLHTDAVDFGLQESPMVSGEGTNKLWFLTPVYSLPNYEVQTDEYNDIPVVIEKSNFGGVCGNLYSVTFWLGEGRLASFSTDCYGEYPYREDIEIIKSITHSFQLK